MGSSEKRKDVESNATAATKKRAAAGSPLTKYFMIFLLLFAIVSMFVNNKFVHNLHHKMEDNVIKGVLKNFKVSNMQKKIDEAMERAKEIEGTGTEPPEDDDGEGGDDDGNDDGESEEGDGQKDGENEEAGDKDGENEEGNGDEDGEKEENGEEEEGEEEGEGESSDSEEEEGDNAESDDEKADSKEGESSDDEEGNEQNEKPKGHTIANLSCEAYGGPSEKDSEEMVYWEDIPKDALHVSPFHPQSKKQDDGTTPITQFLTFESDAGGWNNIRMAMETVLTLAFAMGRTLVLPPQQGMYLIDKQKGTQKNKFSYDHFFHMESISREHIGLDIITTKEFLERCAKGEIVGADNKPIYPPGMRTDWDGLPGIEQKELRQWIREHSGQNLLHWDPEHCIAAFPATNSKEDAQKLAALPDEIAKSPGGWPQYAKYIGKPHDVDAQPIERLKEMGAERTHLCEYTPELQNTRWLHFPVGMKTENGDHSRLLVHFYAFLFFQDWKEDLWMKRFVRDHVRYIDEIQCAAARVVLAIRNRVLERTKGASSDFDTIHIRRGDFQFKETRVEASEILKQLKRVLDDGTTLYIATDERDKSFFKDITDHYPDVIFLDDMVKELGDINTNYYGMIDQLVASRGNKFFGCWFSTFTGYINRLRGYHADDHQLPGYEKGAIESYYYAMPDRFFHMREFWPIKKQFYAREFPASWRLIDSSIE